MATAVSYANATKLSLSSESKTNLDNNITISYDDLMKHVENSKILVYELYQQSNPALNLNLIIDDYYMIESFVEAVETTEKIPQDLFDVLITDINQFLKKINKSPISNFDKHQMVDHLNEIKKSLICSLNYSYPYIICLDFELKFMGVRNNNFFVDNEKIITLNSIPNGCSFILYDKGLKHEFEIDLKNKEKIVITDYPKHTRILFNYIPNLVANQLPDVIYTGLFNKDYQMKKWLSKDPKIKRNLDELFDILKSKSESLNSINPVIREDMKESFNKYIFSIKK